jgi:3-oxoadipate enol-lactonase
MASLLNHALHAGAGGGTALLLIHPLGGDLAFWDDCIRVWSPGRACVACDLRSAGASPRATQPVSIREHVADLEALRKSLGLQTVIPVACAVGTMVAAAYAAEYPERTPALVLANPALRTTDAARAMLAERAALVQRAGMAAILPGAVDKAFLAQPHDERYARYLARFAAQDAQAYALSINGILEADASADLAKVRSPALVVAGAHDVLLPPEQARAVHALLPGARFVLMDDAAHFAPYQKPQQFAALVQAFLGRVAP